MTLLLTTLAAATVSATALAQSASPAPVGFAFNPTAFTVTEAVGVYTKNGNASTVAAFNTLIGVNALGLDWQLEVPVYVSDVAGYGSIGVDASWTPIHSAQFLGASTTVDVEGGLWTPTGSAGYESTNLNPHAGAGVVLDWGAWRLSQTADWMFVTGGTMYDPLLGVVSNDFATLTTGVDYTLASSITVGVDVDQYYLIGGNGTIMVTPNLKWDVANNVDVSVGVGLPVWQELATENNLVLNAGVSIKF